MGEVNQVGTTKLVNKGDEGMTVTGLMALTNVDLTNSGMLTTGNGDIDGALTINSTLVNNGTWNTTNMTMVGGTFANADTFEATGAMTVTGTLTREGEEDIVYAAPTVTNAGTMTVNAYTQLGGTMSNSDTFTATSVGMLDTDFTNSGLATVNGHFVMGEVNQVGTTKLENSGSEEAGKGMTVTGGMMLAKVDLLNTGDLTVGDGTIDGLLTIESTLVNGGTLTTTNLAVLGGSLTNAEGATLNATGSMSIGGTIKLDEENVTYGATLTNAGSIKTTDDVYIAESSTVNLGGSWLSEGKTFYNAGSILNNGGTLTLNGSIAINTTDSNFEVGQLNLTGNAALYHGANAGSDFTGHWVGFYTDDARAKLKDLAGIIDTEVTLKNGDSEDTVSVLTNSYSKDQLVIGKTLDVNGLNLGGTLSSSMQDIAHFGEKSAVIIDVQSLGSEYAFNSEGSKLVVDQGAALILNGVGHGGRYNIAQNFNLSAMGPNSGWTGNSLYAPETSGTGLNWVLDLTWDKLVGDVGNVYVDATLESVGDSKLYNAGGWNVIHKNIVDEVLRTALADNQASTMSLRETTVVGSDGFTNKMYGDLFMNRYLDATTKVLVSNSLASVAQNIGVESLALDNVTDTMKGIEDHASMVGTMPVANGSNLWAQVLGTEHKQDGMKSSGGAKLGYDADDRGFMIGYDIVNGAMNARYGFAMSYLDGSVSSVGDHLATTGDYNTFGLHGYMNWAPTENVNVIATVGYSRGNAEASMNLPKLSGWDSYGKATADVDTNIFSAGIRAETSIKVNNVNIVPHAGLRVMAIDVNGYDTKIDGTTAFHNNADTAVIGQLPFGVTVKGEFETNGWNVKPMADVTFVPQFGETKSQTTTTFPGGTASDVNVAEFTGNFSTNFTFGVEAQKGDYSVGMELGVTKGQNNKTDSSFMAKVRYQF